MKRTLLAVALAAAAWTMGLATAAMPVLAHGDHDARPLARQVAAGPYVLSLWQVYPDAGSAMTPHLIVLLDGAAARPPEAHLRVDVNARPMGIRPSTTAANGWETTDGIAEGDVVRIAISNGIQTWELESVVVPPPPTSMLPMEQLIYISIVLTAGAAWWAARRTARAWRRPAVSPSGVT